MTKEAIQDNGTINSENQKVAMSGNRMPTATGTTRNPNYSRLASSDHLRYHIRKRQMQGQFKYREKEPETVNVAASKETTEYQQTIKEESHVWLNKQNRTISAQTLNYPKKQKFLTNIVPEQDEVYKNITGGH